MNKKTVASIIYTASMAIGVLVCCICDAAVSGALTWSLIVFASGWFAWMASFPVVLWGKKGVLPAMIAVSIFVLPFMHILSRLTGVDEVFSIGAAMAMIALPFLWIIYILYSRFRERKRLATGIALLLAVPFTVLINIVLAGMTGEPAADAWDILSALILLIAAAACIAGDYARKRAC